MKDGRVLLSAEDIRRRVAELGRQISSDYAGRPLAVVGILKGSFVFVADLIRQFDPDMALEVDFMLVSSYGKSTSSTGTARVVTDIELPVAGKNVLLVEDIVDTGLTLQRVYEIMESRSARSLRVAALLEKPGRSTFKGSLDYVGFQIPDRFVVGYGLDHAECYRHLPDIRTLHEI
jgi:hypoxanthine phosphoribosyltransferase